eukprot:Plantae.Rhodophyta-Purpureofilum_apyrenoidigerum.ctg3874.p1 GENE.Plantae.Rhodophyta-Purpureofilum_apyrenoidigerum.ctg3874~~Plantae.Rhodophyta-Purpureofilum_apyrenoidigerum.ctg3874.p1  ORF type:complete len:225 (-),score=43.50 Plantae.Rhodophyta-Purpureofilum_apyrenoidigerum.ctg3874:403-1077(-)
MVSRRASSDARANRKSCSSLSEARIVKALRRRLDAQQKLVNILKERVQTTNILLASEKRNAESYGRDVLQSREAELAKARFELAQERIQRAELDFIAKSLRVELEDDRSQHENVRQQLIAVQAQMELLQEETDQLKTRLIKVRDTSEKSRDKLRWQVERERRVRAELERNLKRTLEQNHMLRNQLTGAKEQRYEVRTRAPQRDRAEELEEQNENVMRAPTVQVH